MKLFLLSTGLLCLLLTLGLLQAQARNTSRQKPNLLCMLVDDLGYAGLAGYESTDLQMPATLDGVSFLPFLLGQNQSVSERSLFWMRREGTLHYNGQNYYAVRRGNRKLVQNDPYRPLELYNLAEDPLEKQDIAGTERKVYEDLSKALQMHIIKSGAIPWQKPE